MDGFEAIDKIQQYLDGSSLVRMLSIKNFKLAPSRQNKSSNDLYFSDLDIKKDRPLIFAFTGDLSPQIELKMKAAGFERGFNQMHDTEVKLILDAVKAR